MTLKNLIDEVEKLPRDEKAELLDAIICMLGPDDPASELTPAQQADLDDRIDEYEAGKAEMLPGEETMRRLRNREI